MPTPSAVGDIIHTIAKEEGISVIGVDIGGATTDVFSVFEGVFNRTVSANLGMSYSVSNVLAEAGVDTLAVRERHGRRPSLRWILVHLVEERLSPEERMRIRERVRAMPPEERQRLRQMTPEERRRVLRGGGEPAPR